MLIDATLILSLLGSCQSSIEPQTLYKLVQVESAGNPFSINTEVPIAQQPTTKDEAIEYAKSLTNLGISYKVGLMQVPISEQGLTISTAFDSCANIKAGANKFKSCLDKATASFPDSSTNEQVQAAASCYHYGNFEDGLKKEGNQKLSYVERFSENTAQQKNEQPQPKPHTKQSEAWDVFKDF
ncbi:hypothetical protein TUM4438_31270 [Shewanella sairae]|uniref:Transglycosylase SLT domain-containing protein n=1 Tax=Shewanella sairae TaxID=190310 RepID=A0ABQ4PMR0_9GAMM|nr:transglycosylase SLT domain-containing protein [Shewanella sairae]MCL1131897.1 transglycosylase SLT domain-containing protein [Shewanella sairae]GIU48880.1 hypothetical protein TUM4438_31270 [Shewanella sairae]